MQRKIAYSLLCDELKKYNPEINCEIFAKKIDEILTEEIL